MLAVIIAMYFSDVQLYVIPNIDIELKMVRTNLAARTTVRGPGNLTCVMIMEEVLERVASHLGLDPVAVRQRNFLSDSKQPSIAKCNLRISPPVHNPLHSLGLTSISLSFQDRAHDCKILRWSRDVTISNLVEERAPTH